MKKFIIPGPGLQTGKDNQGKICMNLFDYSNQILPNVFSQPYQLDESISNFRVVGWYFSFLIPISKETSASKQWRT